MIKSIFEKWNDIENNISIDGNCLSEYFLSNNTYNKVYFGIIEFNKKHLYLEFDSFAIDDYEPPELNGLKMKVTKFVNIDPTKMYIDIENMNETDEVFLAFSSTLIDNIIESPNNAYTIEKLETTIKYYKNYFSNPNKSLSEKEEQGICCELLYLCNLINNYGEKVVDNWLGPNKNKHDFVFDKKAIEIKSTLNQEETSVTISNENQLDPRNLDELRLVVYILEKDPNGVINIVECANKVLSLLNNVHCINTFKSKLLQLNIDVNNYKIRSSYSLQRLKEYLVDDHFPSIRKSTLPSVVFNVTYKINLNSLSEFLVREV